MSDVEAVFWRAEIDPRLRSHGVVVDLLDRAPDWGRLVEAHRWAISVVPSLSARVVDDALHLGPPRWVTGSVDLDWHLGRSDAGQGGFQAVLDVAAALHMEEFDRARPLWRALLIEGLPGGQAAYILKLHHSLSDGQGVIQLFDLLHSHQRSPTPNRVWNEPPLASSLSPAGLAAERVISAVRAAACHTPRLGSTLLKTARHMSRPSTIGDVARYGRSLARISSPGAGAGQGSPLLARRGLDRALRAIERPLDDFKAAGHAAGATVNDVFLAGLLGGVRRYHEHFGVAVGEVPTALPVSLRTATDDPGGNRFAAVNISGPAGIAEPHARILAVHERVVDARSELAVNFMGLAAPVASRLPNRLLAKAAGRLSQGIDVQASNFRGLDRVAYLAGARIEKMFVFGPVPGSALMVTLVSHCGTCCIGVTVDTEAVTDIDLLAMAIEEGLDEVLALGIGPTERECPPA